MAAGGFGDGRNSYAYGYAWYDGHVYIGTNRDLLVMAKTRFRYTVPSVVWPVEVPSDFNAADRGGQIWRYHPPSDTWECVYRSPLVPGLEGRTVPLAAGFRNLCVFQGRSDPRPALYTIPSCGSFGKGPVMLRSIDGVHFEQITEQGMGLGDPNVTAFRSLVVFRDRLFMTPAGSRGGDPNVSYFAAILCTDDPLAGRWERTNVGSFGDPTNYGIYDMCVAGDWLYAGTMNIRHGCQLWKTRAEGKPPFHWIKVFDRGADRGILNQGVVCLTAFGEDVYLGTGIQNGGFDRVNNVGPDAAEVIRVHPDDSWDLVAGTPRMTRQGLKIPTSGLTAGFGNPFAGYVWRMCQHQGAIYVGTYDGSSMFRFAEIDAQARRIFDPATMEHFMRYRGGCELWRSTDGNHWVPITKNGFGNPNNWGIRTLLSTPTGLFVGTANPFGPRIAVQGLADWRYEDNPQGGIEVWHGDWKHAGARDRAQAIVAEPEPLSPVAEATPGERVLGFPEVPWPVELAGGPWGGELAGQGALAEIWATSLDSLLPPTPAGESSSRGNPLHRPSQVEAAADRDHWPKPVNRLAVGRPGKSAPLSGVEEALAEYYLGTELRNVGYWREETWSPARAAQALVDELGRLLPGAGEVGTGAAEPALLAIGHGAAELRARLEALLPGYRVTVWGPGVLGEPAARGKAPAASAPWPGAAGTWDAIVWVEGPWASSWGGAGLAEAWRLLKPGGNLVVADLIGAQRAEPSTLPEPFAEALRHQPARVLHDYRAQLSQRGFAEAETFDLNYYGWFRAIKHQRTYFVTRLLFHHLDRAELDAVLAALPGGQLLVGAHLAGRARKPLTPATP